MGSNKKMTKKVSGRVLRKIILRYKKNISISKIAKELGLCKKTILNHLDANKIRPLSKRRYPIPYHMFKANQKISPEDIKKICDLYISGQSCLSIGKRFNVGHGTIAKYVKNNNILIRDPYIVAKVYSSDNHFFDVIDSEIKAYWLGFIAADGNIHEGALQVVLSSKDHDHLIKLKEALRSTHPIRVYVYEKIERSRFYLRDKYLYNALTRHDGIGEIGRDYKTITLEEVVEDSLCKLEGSPSQAQVVRVLNVLSVARPYIPSGVYEAYKGRYRASVEKKREGVK